MGFAHLSCTDFGGLIGGSYSNSFCEMAFIVFVKSSRMSSIEVKVLSAGFEYEGEVYKSLSAVAKKIAGSHTSGNLFFRLARTQGRGRTVDERKLRPERANNHWVDGVVGCAVAASIQGAVLIGNDAGSTPRRGRVSFAEL